MFKDDLDLIFCSFLDLRKSIEAETRRRSVPSPDGTGMILGSVQGYQGHVLHGLECIDSPAKLCGAYSGYPLYLSVPA